MKNFDSETEMIRRFVYRKFQLMFIFLARLIDAGSLFE